MANKKTNRLDKIYTRSGDTGKTSLAFGQRLKKSDDHIKALGEIDELNCQVGIVIAHLTVQNELTAEFKYIQNSLFDIGAELAMNSSEYPPFNQFFIDNLEQKLDRLNAQLPPLKEFILPGGQLSSAHCHLARAVCRRAERQLIALSEKTASFSQPIKYLNRLSDYLFVAARFINFQNQQLEIFWKANIIPPQVE
ncbi:MAG: cob(I)alamin adenosyltransferase [Oceanospirillaceae bacterium]|jgi:cob(I)alamin adenosyltransferase